MNFFKRAITSVIRKPSKSIILLILVFILGNVIAGAVSVREAVTSTQDAMFDKMGVEVKIEMNYREIDENMDQFFDWSEIKGPIVEDIDNIGSSDFVKYYDYKTRAWFESTMMTNYYVENEEEMYQNTNSDDEIHGYFTAYGGQSPEISDIKTGNVKISDGRMYTQEEIDSGNMVALISKNVADKNGLKVGSIINFERNVYCYSDWDDLYLEADGDYESIGTPEPREKFSYDFEVIGIFEPIQKGDSEMDKKGQMEEQTNEFENVIFTTNTIVNKMNIEFTEANKEVNPEEDYDYTSDIEPVFILNSYNDIDSFKDENSTYLPKYYTFTDNSRVFRNIQSPMANIEWIAGLVLYVAIGATILIISLLVTLFLRDRKHEMGIYLSLGEKKVKIAVQILIEVLLISIIAITASLFSGNALSNNMSEKLLENQIIEEQEYIEKITEENYMNYGYNPMENEEVLSADDVMESYSVDLGGNVILLIYLVAVGTIIISTIVPIAYTLRLNPKKILL